MFDAKDLSALDPKYFSIIFTDAFDVTVIVADFMSCHQTALMSCL